MRADEVKIGDVVQGIGTVTKVVTSVTSGRLTLRINGASMGTGTALVTMPETELTVQRPKPREVYEYTVRYEAKNTGDANRTAIFKTGLVALLHRSTHAGEWVVVEGHRVQP